jgi:hypothetical protein
MHDDSDPAESWKEIGKLPQLFIGIRQNPTETDDMQSSRVVHKVRLLSFVLFACSVGRAEAQPAAPSPPARYDVVLRYRINAARNERIAQFLAMTRYLESVGFNKNPGEEAEAEDPTETRISGSIASANVSKLLLDPHVKSLLLIPAGMMLPEGPANSVKVQLQLVSGLPLDRQRLLTDQVLSKLAGLGFREAIAYDNRGHTRLVGWIPRAELETLLSDLRWEGSGLLAPAVPVSQLPTPLRNASPILVTEVLPAPNNAAPNAAAVPEAPKEGDQKISREFRDLAGREGGARAVRMEVILSSTPRAWEATWQSDLDRLVPGVVIEGRAGPVVTILAAPSAAQRLAQLPSVSVLRLPPVASFPTQTSPQPQSDSDALRASGLDRLHARGARGGGIRIAMIDADFRGYEKLVGNRLPVGTRYIDLTVERNPSVEADEFPSPAGSIGHGTQCALATALAAPEAALTLIRVDPAAPYQLRDVARYIYGEPPASFSAEQRREQLLAEGDRLQARRQAIAAQRKAFLESFGKEPDVAKRREAMMKQSPEAEQRAREREQDLNRQEFELQAEELAHRLRQERFLRLQGDLMELRGTHVVASSLVWNDGYALAGNGPLTFFFDNQPQHKTFWFQAAGDTRGQTWSGLFRDFDGNGVMEFAPSQSPVLLGRWTRELNFMGWQTAAGERTVDLPAKTRLRLSTQWTEAHDPSFAARGEDLYRQPLADLRLLILRQRDPSGTKLGTDDMEVVARSSGSPLRIDNQLAAATYLQQVEWVIDAPGRYALRVEGQVPPGTRPPGTPMLPAIQESWELTPRIFVAAVAPANAGRPVFIDYATDEGSLGMPADSRMLLTVGAAHLDGRQDAATTQGPPLNRDLLTKPNLFAYSAPPPIPGGGSKAFGTSVATSFAAGLTASLLSAGIQPAYLERAFSPPAKLLLVPRGFDFAAIR